MRNVSNYDLIVFDLEDALIVRSKSKCTAATKAVDAYLVKLLGVGEEGGPLFSPQEAEDFARGQGIASEVDLAHLLLVAAVQWLPVEFAEEEFDGYDGRDLLAAVREKGRLKTTLGELAKAKRLQEFAKMLRSKGGGIRALNRLRGLRNRFLVLAEGHIMMDNFVKRIVAEAYLGDELFEMENNQPRQYIKEPGAIDLEECWLSADDIAALRKRCPLGALTSRNPSEVNYVLARLGIDRYLDVVLGRMAGGAGAADPEEARWIRALGVVDNMEADYASKVSEVIERLRSMEEMQPAVRVAYVGNCLPEERALVALKERYRLTLIGCAMDLDKRAVSQMKEKGADYVVTEPAQLMRVLSERPRVRSDYLY